MNRIKYICFTLFLTLSLFYTTHAQTLHIVEVQSNFFSPADITIQVNDTVRWVNVSGFHNVIADDELFDSGDPASGAWEYEFVFTMPGDNPYYCEVHGGPGGSGMSGTITVQNPTSVNDDKTMPNAYRLNDNYPNPFNPSTIISYQVPEETNVKIVVYNISGEEVATILNEFQPAGAYNIEFNAAGLTSGIYFYKLETENFVETRKMVLMK